MDDGLFTNREEIIEFFQKHGILIEPKAVKTIIEKSLGTSIMRFLSNEYLSKGIIRYSDVISLLREGKSESIPAIKEMDFSQLKAGDSIEDFRGMFISRYEKLKSIILNAGRLREVSDIRSVVDGGPGEYRIIGMISEVKKTQNGHLKITVEDEDSIIDAIVMKNNPLSDEIILNDEVIGLVGRKPKSSNFNGKEKPVIFTSEIIRPDIPNKIIHEDVREPEYVCSISDIHVGSKTLLKENFERMIRWFNSGNEDAANVRHIIMSGDVVDGIGVYPGQANDLEIVNPIEQYAALAEYVNQLPEDISVYIMPGNHDTVRLAEPQPAFGEGVKNLFGNNVKMLPNPTNLKIGTKNILIYHGMAINDLIELIPGGSFKSVGKVLELMLKRRYLGSPYGGRTPIIPSSDDHHIIEEVPDIFITGHIHGHFLGNYNGVRYVNSSTWQSQTEYQKMMNYSPDPCIVTLFDLNSKNVIKKNFS